MSTPQSSDASALRILRWASLAEATTLIVLVFIAVPLKYWAGIPSVVSILGPIHGLAFLVYIWMVINTAASGSWNAVEIVRLIVCSFVPLGGYFNEPFIRRRQQKIAGLN